MLVACIKLKTHVVDGEHIAHRYAMPIPMLSVVVQACLPREARPRPGHRQHQACTCSALGCTSHEKAEGWMTTVLPEGTGPTYHLPEQMQAPSADVGRPLELPRGKELWCTAGQA